MKLDVVINVVLVVGLVRDSLDHIERGHIRRYRDFRVLRVMPFQLLPPLNGWRRMHALGEP